MSHMLSHHHGLVDFAPPERAWRTPLRDRSPSLWRRVDSELASPFARSLSGTDIEGFPEEPARADKPRLWTPSRNRWRGATDREEGLGQCRVRRSQEDRQRWTLARGHTMRSGLLGRYSVPARRYRHQRRICWDHCRSLRWYERRPSSSVTAVTYVTMCRLYHAQRRLRN